MMGSKFVIENQAVEGLLTGLVGFSIFAMIAVVVLFIFCIIAWFFSRWVLRKALKKVEVATSGLIYIPFAGDYHMISKLGDYGNFKLFGISVPVIVPQIFIFVNLAGILFLPFVLKPVLFVVGWFLNGAVYTRVWDIADGTEDGKGSAFGLLSAMIPIVFLVKILMMAFSEPKFTVKQFSAQVPTGVQPQAPKEKVAKRKENLATEFQVAASTAVMNQSIEPQAQQAIHLQKVVEQSKQQQPVQQQIVQPPVQQSPQSQLTQSQPVQQQQSIQSVQSQSIRQSPVQQRQQVQPQSVLQPVQPPVQQQWTKPQSTQSHRTQVQSREFNQVKNPERKGEPDSIFL